MPISPISIRDVPEKYKVEINGDQLRVWNGNNGKTYSIEALAPYTDKDD